MKVNITPNTPWLSEGLERGRIFGMPRISPSFQEIACRKELLGYDNITGGRPRMPKHTVGRFPEDMIHKENGVLLYFQRTLAKRTENK